MKYIILVRCGESLSLLMEDKPIEFTSYNQAITYLDEWGLHKTGSTYEIIKVTI